MANRGRKRGKDPRVIRNRRVAIYTFLIIMILFYISAHQTVEAHRAAAAGPGSARGRLSGELAENGREPGAGGSDGAASAEGSLILTEDDMWCLILTNAEYPVPEDYQVELKMLPDSKQSVDARIYDPLMKMLEDMESQGLSPVVCSGYRTLDKQEKLFNRKVSVFVKQGDSKAEAGARARHILSIPGSGEHCLGLAVDFCSRTYPLLEQGFEGTPEGVWLRAHSQDYGFILRYDQGKEAVTGIEYEPWHFRYVGVKAAQYMKEHDQTLEEFYIEEGLYG